jgi:aquaporin Z
LVATWIILEAPISGMSMNPARTVGSALVAGVWTSSWLYFVAPPLGMLLAAEAFMRLRGPAGAPCAKLVHSTRHRCIFCGFLPETRRAAEATAERGHRPSEGLGEPSRPSAH